MSNNRNRARARRYRFRPHDLRGELHGHAVEYACDLDRRYFETHPDERRYVRPAIEHEWCAQAWDGGAGACVPLFEIPVGFELVVVVTRVGEGLRSRAPMLKLREAS